MMKKTKLTFTLLLAAIFAVCSEVSAQIDTPQPSPSGSVSAKVGLTDVEITYFRPQMKGRKIFGSGDDYLLPYGVMWRAGANSGTNVKFSTAVKFGGQDVPAGEYKLIAKPGKDEWTVVLDTDLKLSGDVSGYDESKAAAAAKVKPGKLSEIVSTLTYNISDLSEDGTSANLELAWENTSVKVPIVVDFDEEVMASIEKNTVVNPRNLRTAADYYVKTGKDLDQAIEWYDTYLASGNNKAHFWVIYAKAKALAQKGEKKEAIKTAELSIAKAKEWKDGDFGYIKRNEELIASLK